jgi:hypothetical protein
MTGKIVIPALRFYKTKFVYLGHGSALCFNCCR